MVLELSSDFSLNIWIWIVQILLEGVNQDWVLDLAANTDQVLSDYIDIELFVGHLSV